MHFKGGFSFGLSPQGVNVTFSDWGWLAVDVDSCLFSVDWRLTIGFAVHTKLLFLITVVDVLWVKG